MYVTISWRLSKDSCVAQYTIVQCALSLEEISIHTQLNTKNVLDHSTAMPFQYNTAECNVLLNWHLLFTFQHNTAKYSTTMHYKIWIREDS
jgi:hypothetical protein